MVRDTRPRARQLHRTHPQTQYLNPPTALELRLPSRWHPEGPCNGTRESAAREGTAIAALPRRREDWHVHVSMVQHTRYWLTHLASQDETWSTVTTWSANCAAVFDPDATRPAMSSWKNRHAPINSAPLPPQSAAILNPSPMSLSL